MTEKEFRLLCGAAFMTGFVLGHFGVRRTLRALFGGK
jgi:hypothetical protein